MYALKLHALVAPKRHVRFEADLTDEEALSMHRGTQFVRNKLGYAGGLSHTREGPMYKNEGTVAHIHKNFFEADSEAMRKLAAEMSAEDIKKGKKIEVRVPVAKDPRDRAGSEVRAAEFSARYESGEIPQ